MFARINSVGNDEMDKTDQPAVDPAGPKVNYFSARAEENLLPAPDLLGLIDQEQHDDMKAAVSNLQMAVFENGLAEDKRPLLARLLAGHMEIFCTSFSSGACASPAARD